MYNNNNNICLKSNIQTSSVDCAPRELTHACIHMQCFATAKCLCASISDSHVKDFLNYLLLECIIYICLYLYYYLGMGMRPGRDILPSCGIARRSICNHINHVNNGKPSRAVNLFSLYEVYVSVTILYESYVIIIRKLFEFIHFF